MLEELNQAIKSYKPKWQTFVSQRSDKQFFESLQPTGAGWKVEDLTDFDSRLADIRKHCDHIQLAWANQRWLAICHLLEPDRLEWGIEIAVIMQRRPNSSDPVGFDHLDFLSPGLDEVEKKLRAETGDINWAHEQNSQFSQWVSIRFDGTEAKLRPMTKIDVEIAELQAVSSSMKKQDHNVT